MNDEKNVQNNDKKTFIRNIVVFFVLAIVSVAFIVFPNFSPSKVEKSEFSDVSKICELATLECYYHDVAELKKDPDGLFKYGVFRYGAKKMWMEYDGIVRIGIDVGQVKVEEPDEKGIVKIFVPQAQVLDINADKTSMTNPIEDNGIFTKVTSEEKAQAFAEAQKTMKENAESDESLLQQAQNNAKELLKQYVVHVGEQIGRKYEVQWAGSDSIDTTNEEKEGK